MPVDRSFSLSGIGTVVTGSVHRGEHELDAELVVDGAGGKRIRVVRAELVTEAAGVASAHAAPERPTTRNSAPGTILKVSRDGVEVHCLDGVVRLVTVQPEGKSPMAASDWANGARLPASLA